MKASAKKWFSRIGVSVVVAVVLAFLITAAQIALIFYAFYKGGHPG